MSAAKMVADSTQGDFDEPKKKRKKKKENMKKKSKKLKKRESRKGKGSKIDDEDSDLDLDKELQPIGDYIRERQEMNEQLFHCLRGPTLQRYIPDVLKELSLEDLKKRCLEHLEIMSKKRIRRILLGDDPAIISSSGTEEESSCEEFEPGVSHHGAEEENEIEDLNPQEPNSPGDGSEIGETEEMNDEQDDLEEGETISDRSEREDVSMESEGEITSDESDGEIKDENDHSDGDVDEIDKDYDTNMEEIDKDGNEVKGGKGSGKDHNKQIENEHIRDKNKVYSNGDENVVKKIGGKMEEDKHKEHVTSQSNVYTSKYECENLDDKEHKSLKNKKSLKRDADSPNLVEIDNSNDGGLSSVDSSYFLKTSNSVCMEEDDSTKSECCPQDDNTSPKNINSPIIRKGNSKEKERSVKQNYTSPKITNSPNFIEESDTKSCVEQSNRILKENVYLLKAGVIDDKSLIHRENISVENKQEPSVIKSTREEMNLSTDKFKSRERMDIELTDISELPEGMNVSSKGMSESPKGIQTKDMSVLLADEKTQDNQNKSLRSLDEDENIWRLKQETMDSIKTDSRKIEFSIKSDSQSDKSGEIRQMDTRSVVLMDKFEIGSSISGLGKSVKERLGPSKNVATSSVHRPPSESLEKRSVHKTIITKDSCSNAGLNSSSTSTKQISKASSSKVVPEISSAKEISKTSLKVVQKPSASQIVQKATSSKTSSKVLLASQPSTSSNTGDGTDGALAPVLTKNQMELLELEMRARAIKAMLAAHEKKEKQSQIGGRKGK